MPQISQSMDTKIKDIDCSSEMKLDLEVLLPSARSPTMV